MTTKGFTTVDELVESVKNQTPAEKLKGRLAFQEILESLPYRSPKQIEKDWQEVKRHYGVS